MASGRNIASREFTFSQKSQLVNAESQTEQPSSVMTLREQENKAQEQKTVQVKEALKKLKIVEDG